MSLVISHVSGMGPLGSEAEYLLSVAGEQSASEDCYLGALLIGLPIRSDWLLLEKGC